MTAYAQKQEYTYGQTYTVTWKEDDYDRSSIPSSNLGYCIKDFDGDGQDELLILEIDDEYAITAEIYEADSGKVSEAAELEIEYPESEAEDHHSEDEPEVAGLYDGTLEVFVFDHDGIKIALDDYRAGESDKENMRKLAVFSYSGSKLSIEKVIYLGESVEGWGTDADPFSFNGSAGDNRGRDQLRTALEGYGAENVPEGSEYLSTGTRFVSFFPSATVFARQDFQETVSISQQRSGGSGLNGEEVGTVSFAAQDESDSENAGAGTSDDDSYCRDLNAQFNGFTLAAGEKPVDKGDYYELSVTVYTEGDYEIAEKEMGRTTVRIRKDAQVLYMWYPEGSVTGTTSLISLDEYAGKKYGVSSYADCNATRIWSNVEDPSDTSADQAYKVFYDANGYIMQFYDGEFE